MQSKCYLDVSGRVIYQSEACLSECGLQSDGCKRGISPSLDRNTMIHSFSSMGSVTRFLAIYERKQLAEIVLLNKPETSFRLDTLTKQEKKIIEYRLLGLNNNEISELLGVQRETTRVHLKNLYKKLPEDISDRLRSQDPMLNISESLKTAEQ